MNRTTVLWGIILILVVALGVSIWWGLNRSTKPVAVIGQGTDQVVITEEEWINQLKKQYGRQVLEDMINRRVVFLQAQKASISVRPEDVEAELREMKAGYPNDAAFYEAIRQQLGLTPEELRKDIEFYLLWEELATQGVKVSEEQMRAYYEQNKERFVEPARAHVFQILVPTLEEAQQVLNELDAGVPFEEVAKRRSTDKATAGHGGDLGQVELDAGYLPSNVAAAAKTLPLNQVSAPLPVEGGYAIIKVTERTPARQRPFEEVKNTIRRELALSQVGSLQAVLDRLEAQVGVKQEPPFDTVIN